MVQPKRWLDEIIDALSVLGGYGTLNDLNNLIEERNIMDFNANRNWKNQIRETIYRYSSDSRYFKGGKNIFYSVDGIRKGHWGLRDFEPNEQNVDLTEDDMGFEEGKKKLILHLCRERNYRVVNLAKEDFLKKHGRLFCEICSFDFEHKYGQIGKGFIEGHHIIPVSEIPEGYKTKPHDIVLVCSNCHKMLHRKRPWLSKDELMKLIEQG